MLKTFFNKEALTEQYMQIKIYSCGTNIVYKRRAVITTSRTTMIIVQQKNEWSPLEKCCGFASFSRSLNILFAVVSKLSSTSSLFPEANLSGGDIIENGDKCNLIG